MIRAHVPRDGGTNRSLRWLHRSLACVALAACAACAATSSASSSRGGANLLTQADLLQTNTASVFEAIQQARPQWLQARGAGRIGEPAEVLVFVNDAPAGDIGVLRSWRITDILDVRFLTATDAATRYGTTAESGGVIVMRTR